MFLMYFFQCFNQEQLVYLDYPSIKIIIILYWQSIILYQIIPNHYLYFNVFVPFSIIQFAIVTNRHNKLNYILAYSVSGNVNSKYEFNISL